MFQVDCKRVSREIRISCCHFRHKLDAFCTFSQLSTRDHLFSFTLPAFLMETTQRRKWEVIITTRRVYQQNFPWWSNPLKLNEATLQFFMMMTFFSRSIVVHTGFEREIISPSSSSPSFWKYSVAKTALSHLLSNIFVCKLRTTANKKLCRLFLCSTSQQVYNLFSDPFISLDWGLFPLKRLVA